MTDTPAKRAAALGVGQPPGVILPLPDGDIDAANRGQLAGVALPGTAEANDDIVAAAPAIPVKTPGLTLAIPIDWSEYLSESVTLEAVEYEVPSPLTREGDDLDAVNGVSQVSVSGGLHGVLYKIACLATRSNGTQVTKVMPLRVFNG